MDFLEHLLEQIYKLWKNNIIFWNSYLPFFPKNNEVWKKSEKLEKKLE